MSDDLRPESRVPPFPGSSPGEGMAAGAPKKTRSGSEKRKRYRQNLFRSTVEERAEIEANAAAAGLTFGAFMRSLGCVKQTTRASRRRLPELLPFTQAMGRLGIYCSNAYQLLKLVRCGGFPDVEEIREAHKKLNMAADELLAVIRGYTGDHK